MHRTFVSLLILSLPAAAPAQAVRFAPANDPFPFGAGTPAVSGDVDGDGDADVVVIDCAGVPLTDH